MSFLVFQFEPLHFDCLRHGLSRNFPRAGRIPLGSDQPFSRRQSGDLHGTCATALPGALPGEGPGRAPAHAFKPVRFQRKSSFWIVSGRKSWFELIGKPMTSDHRVAGSSPAGCRSSPIAACRVIKLPKNRILKTAVIRLLSVFPVLLASLTGHVRTTTDIFACRQPRQVHA
jgi:hypothetical protein